MRHNKRYWLVLGATLSVLAVIGLAGTLYWAWARTQALAVAELNERLGVVMQRSADTRQQQLALVDAMQQGPAVTPCSPEHLARMRQFYASAAYIQGVGFVAGGKLLCSTLTPAGVTVDLGQPDRIGEAGFQSYTAVTLPGLDKPFKIDVRGSYAMLLIPEQVMESGTADPEISIAHIGTRDRPWTLVRHRGDYDFAAMLGSYAGQNRFWGDAHYFVARTVDEPRAIFLGAMSRTRVMTLFQDAMLQVVLPGVLLTLSAMTLAALFIRHRYSLRADISRALKNNEFHLYYQPVVSLEGGTFVGAEALIRWTRPDGRNVHPGEFIPVAERTGLIHEVTQTVIDLVAQDVARLVQEIPGAHIAINLAPSDVDSPLTQVWLTKMVERAQVASDNVMVEITERGVMEKTSNDKLVSIRAQGFRLAIDDFGTGQSSLSQIANYRFDFLKIDKSFVDVISTDTLASKVAHNVITLAKSLGMQMIAEGVETEEQSAVLRKAGVQYAQGWLFAKAMPFEDLLQYARLHKAAVSG